MTDEGNLELLLQAVIREKMRITTDSKQTQEPGVHSMWDGIPSPPTVRYISDFRRLTCPLPAKAFCVDLTTAASAPGNLKQ